MWWYTVNNAALNVSQLICPQNCVPVHRSLMFVHRFWVILSAPLLANSMIALSIVLAVSATCVTFPADHNPLWEIVSCLALQLYTLASLSLKMVCLAKCSMNSSPKENRKCADVQHCSSARIDIDKSHNEAEKERRIDGGKERCAHLSPSQGSVTYHTVTDLSVLIRIIIPCRTKSLGCW